MSSEVRETWQNECVCVCLPVNPQQLWWASGQNQCFLLLSKCLFTFFSLFSFSNPFWPLGLRLVGVSRRLTPSDSVDVGINDKAFKCFRFPAERGPGGALLHLTLRITQATERNRRKHGPQHGLQQHSALHRDHTFPRQLHPIYRRSFIYSPTVEIINV